MKKFELSKSDKEEIKALLTFLSGITRKSAIKSIKFERESKETVLQIQRFDDDTKKTFCTFTFRKKIKNQKK